MTNWIISANPMIYNFDKSFKDYPSIDWGQQANFQVNDIIFIYTSGRDKVIQHKCIVQAINLTYPNIRDDREYYYDLNDYYKSIDGKKMRLILQDQADNIGLTYANLKNNGLKSKLQKPVKIKPELLDYIVSNFFDSYQTETFPELINNKDPLFEGIKKQVFVNKYERSATARKKCLDSHKPICSVCDLNFAEKYGEIGRDFIHVHHLIPIHKIGIKYEINYEKDLIPVCPNCHAMLHRKINDTEPTVEELKEMIKNHKS